MMRVLIADDSEIFAEVLAEVLEGDGDLAIAGVARDGAHAVALARTLGPDVIVMDVVMPVLDGFEAVSQIMAARPTPILMMTGDARAAELGFEALRRGAVDLVQKPAGWPFGREERQRLRDRVRAVAGIRPVSRAAAPPSARRAPRAPAAGAVVVGLAASTGGPAALAAVLRDIPADFPAGIAIVQHLSPGFADAFTRWLASLSALRVAVAREGDVCAAGNVLIAPDHRHLTLDREGRARLSVEPRELAPPPAADVLLGSIAESFGPRAVGAVLTGMGEDGARGLAAMRRAGATTLAQDQATSVVYGMPRAALACGAAERAVPLPEIAPALRRAVRQQRGAR